MTVEQISFLILFRTSTDLMNKIRHTSTTGSSKWAIELSIVSLSLHFTVPWRVPDSPLDSDHCVIIVDIHTRSRELQSTIAKFNKDKLQA